MEVLRRLGHEQVELVVANAPAPNEAWTPIVPWIAQEALQNALRHASAGRIVVSLGGLDGRLELEVADDGVGFDPTAADVRSRRLGLTSMGGACPATGGTLEIGSTPGVGTTVRLEADGG